MMSLYKKEATRDAGVTMNSTNAAEMYGFDSDPPSWPDDMADDGGEINGGEFPTLQEILRKKVEIDYSEPRVKPNTLAGLAALVLGDVTATQDGVLVAYRQRIKPVAHATALPSIQVEVLDGTQWAYKGVVGKSLKISGKEDGFIAADCKMIGSGTRATSATAFPAKVTESWIKTTQMKVWLESGASISIDATPTQLLENISSGTPSDLSSRIKSFDFEWDNNNFVSHGYGSEVLVENDKGPRRSVKLSFSLLFKDDTELNLFINQTTAAIEFDAKGALIASGGTMYYGMDLIVPAFKLKPISKKGKVGDWVTQDFEALVIDNGTNPVVDLYVYTAKTGFMAA